MPKILVVFENVIGYLPPEDEKSFKRAAEKGNWVKAAGYWRLLEPALRKLIDMTMRQHLNVEAVSFSAYPDLAGEFEEKLSDAGVPVPVWHSSPEWLARKIAVMPDVSVLYDPEPARQLLYGKKGRLLTNVNEMGY